MSSDNYYLVGKVGDKFGAYHGMGDDYPESVAEVYLEYPRHVMLFDTLEQAMRYASNEYTEYGVSVDDSI